MEKLKKMAGVTAAQYVKDGMVVELGKELKAMVGVVEHGLFNGMVNKVIVAGKDGVNILEAK